MKKKCISPQLGGKISNEIVFKVATQNAIHLTAEQSQHLAQCEECSQLLPLWFKKGAATRETSKAYHIVNLAHEGDARVLKKTKKSATTLLFKADEDDSSRGLLVEISLTGEISDAKEVTLEEFRRLE